MTGYEKTKRILIVDDEKVITDTLVLIFSRSGYEARGVFSAEQALSLMDHWHPHLAIIDVMLPGMNGIDLAIRIRSEWPECHISLFSGQTTTGALFDQAKVEGNKFDILAKPVHPSELLGIASRLLGDGPKFTASEN